MNAQTFRLTALLAAGLTLVVGALLAGDAGAGDSRASRSMVLGKTAVYPSSACPDPDRCEVIARVTGIQMRADGTEHPFRVPVTGRLVAWWLKLPRLQSAQIQSFNGLFGGEPAARVAVLRRGNRGRFRLVRQGPVQPLRADLDGKGRARYRLAEPLLVKEGDYIGLTAVTWMPAFAVNLDAAGNSWLASRSQDRCSTPPASRPKRFAAYYRRTQAHVRNSTVKVYRCSYQTARLLYWARIEADDPEPPGGGTAPDG
jgi:hypothetical protein